MFTGRSLSESRKRYVKPIDGGSSDKAYKSSKLILYNWSTMKIPEQILHLFMCESLVAKNRSSNLNIPESKLIIF